MKKEIATTEAPPAIGPYSQAVSAAGLVFASGQLGLSPASGEMAGESAAAQAARALENLGAVLEAAGSGMDRVLKVTVYLVEMSDFEAVNDVYARYFGRPFPARACVGVKALPKGARVEIEAVALAG